MLFAHTLHVNVAESSAVADVAVETPAVDFCEEMLTLLMHHWHSQLLVQRGVPKSHRDTVSAARLLVDGGRGFGALCSGGALGVVFKRVVKSVLAVEFEGDETKGQRGHGSQHLPFMFVAAGDDEESDDAV
jgi:hypothetical protein